MSKRTKALNTTPAVRKEVYVRDNGRCILCGQRYNLQVAHYVSKGAGGLGIPENLVMLCVNCHLNYDQSKNRQDIGKLIYKYLNYFYNMKEVELRYKR